MLQLRMNHKDINQLLGVTTSSDFFNGKKDLSLAQIRVLHRELHIPTHILVGA